MSRFISLQQPWTSQSSWIYGSGSYLATVLSLTLSRVRDRASGDYSSSRPGTLLVLHVQVFGFPGIKVSMSYHPRAAALSHFSNTRQRASALLQKQPATTCPFCSIQPSSLTQPRSWKTQNQTDFCSSSSRQPANACNRTVFWQSLLSRGQPTSSKCWDGYTAHMKSWLPSPPGTGAQSAAGAQHLDLSVASVQQPDGKQDALLEDLLVLGVHDEVSHQLGGPFSVQPALDSSDSGPVLVLACMGGHGWM